MTEAKRYGEEAIALLADPAYDAFVWAYTDLAMVALYEGDPSGAINLVKAGADHPADARDRFSLTCVLYFLAVTNHTDEALAIADSVIARVTACGVPRSIAVAHTAKGLALAKADPARALASLDQALAVARRSGAPFWVNSVLIDIANLQARSGEPRTALESFREVLREASVLRDSWLVSIGLSALVVLFERLGRTAIAAALYGALPKSLERGQLFGALSDAVDRVRAGLGDAAFDAAQTRGAAMSLGDAAMFAREAVETALLDLEPDMSKESVR
jgi:hypothetical protein